MHDCIAATYNCPRVVPTPPPCPSSTTTSMITSSTHTTPTSAHSMSLHSVSISSMKISFSIEATSISTIKASIGLQLPTLAPAITSNLIPATTDATSQDSTSIKTISADCESLEVVKILSTPVGNFITPTQPDNPNDTTPSHIPGDQTGVIASVVLAAMGVILAAIFIIALIMVVACTKRNKLKENVAYTKISSKRINGKQKRFVFITALISTLH